MEPSRFESKSRKIKTTNVKNYIKNNKKAVDLKKGPVNIRLVLLFKRNPFNNQKSMFKKYKIM
jgi:hypothetical protein